MTDPKSLERGLIYLVRLSRDDHQYKVGFTKNAETLKKRLGEYKRSNPQAETVTSWPAIEMWEHRVREIMASRLSVERAVAGYLFQRPSREVGDEVIRGSKRELVERGDKIFKKFLLLSDFLESGDDA